MMFFKCAPTFLVAALCLHAVLGAQMSEDDHAVSNGRPSFGLGRGRPIPLRGSTRHWRAHSLPVLYTAWPHSRLIAYPHPTKPWICV